VSTGPAASSRRYSQDQPPGAAATANAAVTTSNLR